MPLELGFPFTCGVVSATGRSNVGFNEIEDFVQTDAAVNPGASGGALVLPDGQLVGMIDGIFTKEADIDAGVNFAVSLQMIEESLEAMRANGVSSDWRCGRHLRVHRPVIMVRPISSG